MPMYDYKCSKCEHVFTELLSMDNRKDPETKPCPNCNEQNTIEQSLCAPAIVDSARIGLTKPKGDFRERMQQIKQTHKYDRKAKIKQY